MPEALPHQCRELALDDVEPTSVNRRVGELDALRQPPGFGRLSELRKTLPDNG